MGLYLAQVKPASALIRIVAIKFVLAFLKNVIRMRGEAYEKDGITYKSFRINLSGSGDLPSGKNLIHKHNASESSCSEDLVFFIPNQGELEEMKIFKEMFKVDGQNTIWPPP